MQSGSHPQTQDNYSNIKEPNAEDLSYQIQKLVEQGVMTPEDAKAALAGRSEMDNVTTDPRLEQAQMGALDSLQNIASSGGMTDMDKANLNQISIDEATKAKGQRDAIIQNAQSRGLGGSGLDLMAQLQNEQSSASNKSQRDLSVAGQAQQRALDAIMQEGNLASTVQSNKFNQGAQKASANDAISKFNAQNTQAVNVANTNAHNAAQAANLENKQGIANANAGIQTQQNGQKAQVAQQLFNNQIAKAGGSSSIAQANAKNAGTDSQNAANAQNQTIGTGLTAIAMMSDEREKKDVEPFDPSEFLDKITSVKFKYKNPAHGQGERYGTTAQDLEKSKVGASIVKDTPEGKVIDTTQATGPMLAALSDLQKRLKKVEGE